MAKPTIPDWETIRTMIPGYDPNNVTPYKDYIKKILRVNDEQLAVNRFKWINLPPELNGQLIERILYYRGQGMLFFIPETKKFYFLPYCLDGTIDVYGRYTSVKPLPFNGKSETNDPMSIILSTQKREPVYDIMDLDIDPETFLSTKCILLSDYCKQLSQTVISRQQLNDGLIDIESNIIPYMNTMLSNSTGVTGVRVNGDDEAAQITIASDTANLAALNGKRFLAINGQLDFQDLASQLSSRAEDMLMSMQSLDNIRLGTYGLDNGGIFEKKAHLLNAEAAMNTGTSSLVMEDCLYQRQQLCDIVNNYLLLPMGYPPELLWDCVVNEVVTGNDQDLDGIIGGNEHENLAQGLAEPVQEVDNE